MQHAAQTAGGGESVSSGKSVAGANALILPGIGAFDACMQALELRAAGLMLEFAAPAGRCSGICVGMQMLTLGSEEGDPAGLGLIRAHTRGLRRAAACAFRIWAGTRRMAQLRIIRWPESAVENRFYFVHSFRVICESAANSLASALMAGILGGDRQGNIAGVQFHPEKSHRFGLQLLENFSTVMNSLRPRVIPCLQFAGGELFKTRRFKDPLYLGDPINAVKLFNDLECDELVVVDIRATLEGREPDYAMIEEFASEAFMPLTYGGGINQWSRSGDSLDRYRKSRDRSGATDGK